MACTWLSSSLAESVCQTSKAAHRHPHREVLAFNVMSDNIETLLDPFARLAEGKCPVHDVSLVPGPPPDTINPSARHDSDEKYEALRCPKLVVCF